MKIDRRSFIGGSTALLSGALGVSSANAKTPVVVAPFVETRGAPSNSDPKEMKAIAEHIANVKHSDMDATTIEKAKHRVLDLVGCAIGGIDARGNAALAKTFQGSGGLNEATIIGYPGKVGAAQAAMANAIIARSYDFEVMTVVVGDRVMGSHIAPTTSMVALALAEQHQRSGKDFLTALILGDDIAARVLASSTFNFAAGWDGSAVYSVFGATTVASRLLGLSPQEIHDAFGISVEGIAGTIQGEWDGSTTWKYGQGLMAQNGITSAQLAQGGWVGMGDPLLSPYGFYSQFTGGFGHPEVLLKDLGSAFYGEEYFKPYPSCAATHSSHECAIALKEKYNLGLDDIQSVTILLSERSLHSALAQKFSAGRDPQCSANFNIPFQVVTGLLRGPIRQEHYTDEAINAPEITKLLEMTTIAVREEGTSGVDIEITTKNGDVVKQHHTGTPSRNPTLKPSTYEQIVEKFHEQLAFSGRVSPQKADEIIQRIEGIEDEKNMADFIKLIS